MRRAALLLLLASLPAAAAHAGDFPSRTVTIVSPYQAGATSDLIARVLAQKLGERWGRPVIVENKPGANGVNAVVSAAPDGHTLLAVAWCLRSNSLQTGNFTGSFVRFTPMEPFCG